MPAESGIACPVSRSPGHLWTATEPGDVAGGDPANHNQTTRSRNPPTLRPSRTSQMRIKSCCRQGQDGPRGSTATLLPGGGERSMGTRNGLNVGLPVSRSGSQVNRARRLGAGTLRIHVTVGKPVCRVPDAGPPATRLPEARLPRHRPRSPWCPAQSAAAFLAAEHLASSAESLPSPAGASRDKEPNPFAAASCPPPSSPGRHAGAGAAAERQPEGSRPATRAGPLVSRLAR
jgi:hypothetical protein